MSEPYSEELLSAYVDGELSPQVRAAVERWVENSPEARQKVEEFRRLSRLFGDLSRTEVPREFPVEVLHLAERRMLLPEAAAGRGRKRIRQWALALAAPIAAAALLLIFKFSARDDAARDRSVIVADRTKGAPAPISNNAGRNEVALRLRDTDRPSADEMGSALPPSAAPGGMGAGGAGVGGVGGGGGATSAATAPELARSKNAAAPGGPLSPDAETDPQLLAFNEAVQEVRETGAADKLLVVRVYVADWADGLVLLQVLQDDFAANNIRIDSAPAQEGKAAVEAKPVGEASDQGLYVVAQADVVIAGYKTLLARRHPGARVFVEPSIELAALDAQSQKQFLLGEGEPPVDELRRGDEATKESKDAPEGAKPAASRSAPAAAGEVKNSKADDADAKANKKSSQSSTPRRNAPSPSNPRTNQKSGLGNRTIERHLSVHPPSDKGDDEKVSQTAPEGNQIANNARQMVVPVVPPAIQNRARSSGAANSQANRNLAGPQRQAAPVANAAANNRDEKPLVQDEKLDESAPAFVRVLIVIEREPKPPDAPAAKKGPSGGAS